MKKHLRYFLLFFLIHQLSYQAFSQDDKPLRVEIETNKDSKSFTIIPFGEKGALLFYKSIETDKKKDLYLWNFILYNNDLKKIWSMEQSVPTMMQYQLIDHDSTNLYLLYFEENYHTTKFSCIKILKVNIDSASIKSYSICPSTTIGVTSFKAVNNIIMIAGFTATITYDYQPYIFTYNLNNDSIKIIHDPYDGIAFADNLGANIDNNFDISVRNLIRDEKANYMYINEYNTDSKINSIKLISNNYKRKLSTCKVLTFNDNEKIVIGTYNQCARNYKLSPLNKNTNPEWVSGIFFCRINNNTQDEIKFYNFTQLKGFYLFYGEKLNSKILKKAKLKELKGKELNSKYVVLMHDIIKKDSDYIMAAETYYPRKETVIKASEDHQTSSYPTPHDISTYSTDWNSYIAGYNCHNIIIARFDNNGNIKWDSCYTITKWDSSLTIKRSNPDLTEMVKVFINGDDINLAYCINKGNIAYKIIHTNGTVESKQLKATENYYPNEELIYTLTSDLKYWYDKYFISFGYQKVKNTQDNSKRFVFYIDKVAFH